MRVALFSGNYCATKDGAAVALNRLVAYLERQGVEVLVFSPTVEKPMMEPVGAVVSVRSVPLPGRGEYRIAFGLPKECRRRLDAFKPTLIHIAAPDLLGYAALRYARAHDVPAVASFHTRFETYLRYYGLRWLEGLAIRYLRHFYSRCEHLYPPSESMADELRKLGVGGEIRMWTRGVDRQEFNPARRSLEWRRSLGIGDDDVVVSFVSRLVKEKGLETFASVLDTLTAQGVAHKALVIGQGPELDWMRERMPAAVFTGHLNGQDLARGYASGDIFFFPSVTETFGIVTLEAMASGLAPVCADATGSRSLISDGETGYLVARGDHAAFVEKVGSLVTDRARRERVSQAAVTRAAAFDWDNAMRAIHGHYIDLASQWNTPAVTTPLAVERPDRPTA